MTGTRAGWEPGAEVRRDAVAAGLLPIMRIADRPLRWTMGERLDAYGCPGVSVAVMKDGRIDWVDGFGTTGPDTVFMVASCSKPVTAMLVLVHVDRGVLDLDVDVNRYLRRWQVPANEFTAEQPVTLRRILSHTAGLTVNGWGIYRADEPLPTVIDLLEGRPPSTQAPVVVDRMPDGRDRYSGGGYLIAQMVLEDVTGRPFADLAAEHLFGPLGMTRSTFVTPLPTQLLDDAADGHGDDGRSMPAGSMVGAEMAAGGLCSSARDYATFLLAVSAAFRGERDALIGQALATEMATRQASAAFGLGVRVLGEGDGRRLNHGGSNDGYQTETNLYPATGDGGVVFTNSTSGLFLFREVFNGIAEVYGWDGFMPPPKRLATLSPEEMASFEGTYRIVSGIELPRLKVWVQDGKLWNEIPGLRFGVQEVYCDVDGVLFNQTGPFETAVTRGPDGRVQTLAVHESDVLVLSAERVDE